MPGNLPPVAVTPHYRIKGIGAIALRATAAILDVLGFATGVTGFGLFFTWLLGVMGDIVFPLVFKFIFKVQYLGKNAGTKLGGSIFLWALKLTPIVDALPWFSIQVDMMIRVTRKEDLQKARDEAAAAQEEQIRQQVLQVAAARRAANENNAREAEEEAFEASQQEAA